MSSFARKVERPSDALDGIRRVAGALQRQVLGQERACHRVLLTLVAGGHLLLEGVPGLAKTRLVRALAGALDVSFRRIQFTPDLLPADITGTMIYREATGSFVPAPGPLFANLVLADEINRAPPRVQSALLEAMEERQVTLGGESHPLREPFMVLATRNPIEQHGTYPLSEAQLDRFMMLVRLDYPSREDEAAVLRSSLHPAGTAVAVSGPEEVLRARREAERVHVDDRVVRYVTDLLRATRRPEEAGLPELTPFVAYGASTRAGIFLQQAARAHAYLAGRSFVSPSDVKEVAPEVLAHRLILSFEADAEGVRAEDLLDRILDAVPVP